MMGLEIAFSGCVLCMFSVITIKFFHDVTNVVFQAICLAVFFGSALAIPTGIIIYIWQYGGA